MSSRARVWVFLLTSILFLSGAQMALAKTKKLPDLMITSLTSDAVAIAGEPLRNVVAEVVNQGKKPAGAFRIHYYLSTDATITPADIDTGATCEIAGLARGETARCATSI